jgi:DMATS type aromatic prenyltransferase
MPHGSMTAERCLHGKLFDDDETRAAASRDFGGLTKRLPQAVVRADDVGDVVQAVRLARARGLSIVARGQGHSTRGQALSNGGLVVDTRKLSPVHVSGRSVIAGAGATWDAVLQTTLSFGLAPPVLTDYLGLSVGGTLSVGGVGGQSFRYGTQTDHVDELTVVTGRGEVVVCSPICQSDLFDACRAGLGQCAIIVQARLRLSDAPSEVQIYELAYENLNTFLAEQKHLSGNRCFDCLRGSVLPRPGYPWGFRIEAVKYLAYGESADEGRLLDSLSAKPHDVTVRRESYAAYASRLAAMVQAMKRSGTWNARHPWMDLFLPAGAAGEFVEVALSELEPSDVIDGHVMTYPLVRSACSTPLLQLPNDANAFLFDILPNVSHGDDRLLARLEKRFLRLFERARSIGARIYPIGFPVGEPLMADLWRWQLGQEWDRLNAAKRKYDPDLLLTPSPELFGPADAGRRHVNRPATLGALADEKFRVVGRVLNLQENAERAKELFHVMSGPWNQLSISDTTPWTNDITDDATPFELCLAFGQDLPQIRFLLEPQQLPAAPMSSWTEGHRVARELGRLYGADLTRLHAISDLFAPSRRTHTRFSMWLAAAVTASGPLFKAYVNPEIRGSAMSALLVEQALARLDLRNAWSFVSAKLGTGKRVRIPYLSLDLEPGLEARVKVYLSLEDVTSGALEERLSGCRNWASGEAQLSLDLLLAGARPSTPRPILTCFAFSPGTEAPDVTIHVPIRAYVQDDVEALRRALLVIDEANAERLQSAVRAIADRPLEMGRGLLTYVSLCKERNHLRVSVYLAPQAYAVMTPQSAGRPARRIDAPGPQVLAPVTMADVKHDIDAHQKLFACHPFMRRLERGGTIQEFSLVARRLAFFVMTFQDVLRLARKTCSDPNLHVLVCAHEAEDRGHDAWFLHDLQQFGIEDRLDWIFLKEYAVVRDLSYSLIAEVLRATDDRTRLAVVMALEAAGREFFRRAVEFLERLGKTEGLLYFARRHQDVEQSHSLFRGSAQAKLTEMDIPDESLEEVTGAVAVTFSQMWRLAGDMETALDGMPRQARRHQPGEELSLDQER